MANIKTIIRLIRKQSTVPVKYQIGQIRSYPSARDEKDFFSRNARHIPEGQPARALDLGCGTSPQNPFKADSVQGIDIRENSEQGVIAADLCSGHIPFPDGGFDFVTAFDLIEHIPRVLYSDGKSRFPFVELMSEICRVLKEGGIFYSHTPAFPSKQAFQDPTHVNIITEDTFPFYFCGGSPLAGMYGFQGNFELVVQEWHFGHLLTLMKKARKEQ